MSKSVRICLVSKMVGPGKDVIDCLESIEFQDENECFHISDHFQPLSNHNELRQLGQVKQALKGITKLDQFRNIQLSLPEEVS